MIKIDRNKVFYIMDSVRWDQFQKANTKFIDSISEDTIKSYSSASWTLASMKAIIHGIIPSSREKTLFNDFKPWFYPIPNKPQFDNYHSCAFSANPLFSSVTFPNVFDHFNSISSLNEGNGDKLVNLFLKHYNEQMKEPFVVFFLFVETHYPYMGKNHDREEQIRGIEFLDKLFGQFYNKLPKGTDIWITSDHGEKFYEDGSSSHDPRPQNVGHSGCLNYPELFEVFTSFARKG